MSGITITTSELILIIKACREGNVESLDVSDIKLKFYNNKHHNQNGTIALSQDEMSDLGEIGENLSHLINEDDPVASDEQLIDEEYLAQLSIDDPLAYEELSLKKLLEEGN